MPFFLFIICWKNKIAGNILPIECRILNHNYSIYWVDGKRLTKIIAL